MDKDTAREILQAYIDKQTALHGVFQLPVTDFVLGGVGGTKESDDTVVTPYTWRYLIAIAYGLEFKTKNQNNNE